MAASVDIPQKVILGLVQAVQAQSSDAEVRLLLMLIDIPPQFPSALYIALAAIALKVEAAARGLHYSTIVAMAFAGLCLPARDSSDCSVISWYGRPKQCQALLLVSAYMILQVQQALVLALAHCLSISSNADLQQQVIDEVLRDLVPACQHLHSLFHSPGT